MAPPPLRHLWVGWLAVGSWTLSWEHLQAESQLVWLVIMIGSISVKCKRRYLLAKASGHCWKTPPLSWWCRSRVCTDGQGRQIPSGETGPCSNCICHKRFVHNADSDAATNTITFIDDHKTWPMPRQYELTLRLIKSNFALHAMQLSAWNWKREHWCSHRCNFPFFSNGKNI